MGGKERERNWSCICNNSANSFCFLLSPFGLFWQTLFMTLGFGTLRFHSAPFSRTLYSLGHICTITSSLSLSLSLCVCLLFCRNVWRRGHFHHSNLIWSHLYGHWQLLLESSTTWLECSWWSVLHNGHFHDPFGRLWNTEDHWAMARQQSWNVCRLLQVSKWILSYESGRMRAFIPLVV